MRLAARVALLALAWCWASGAAAEQLEGRVTLAVGPARLADVLPVVVYLERVDAEAASRGTGLATSIGQHNAKFSPGFMAVAAGTRIEMPNEDDIFHNVFSYSRGNAFDLGLYPAGESRSVELKTPGVVKLYCSIHESMNATIFVAPTHHLATVDARGRFALRDVAPGRYRLRTWCERLPETQREIMVRAGSNAAVEIRIGETAVPAAPAPGND